MSVHMWTKKETQMTISSQRNNGYIIKKLDGIYHAIDENGKPWMIEGKPLFSAMVGNRGYLVNLHEILFFKK